MRGCRTCHHLCVDDLPMTWRTTRAARIAGLMLSMLFVLMAFAIMAVDHDLSAVTPLVICLGVALACWRAVNSALTLTQTELVIRNPVLTYQVKLEDIIDVRPGYSGIEVMKSDGSKVSAWAVQKANYSAWAGKETRADVVASCIRRALVRSRMQ